MPEGFKFSSGIEPASKEALEAEDAEAWEECGSWVPAEDRAAAKRYFNATGKNPRFLRKITTPEKQALVIAEFKAYGAAASMEEGWAAKDRLNKLIKM